MVVSLNSRLESNKEEEEGSYLSGGDAAAEGGGGDEGCRCEAAGVRAEIEGRVSHEAAPEDSHEGVRVRRADRRTEVENLHGREIFEERRDE